jgi:acylphosphatase
MLSSSDLVCSDCYNFFAGPFLKLLKLYHLPAVPLHPCPALQPYSPRDARKFSKASQHNKIEDDLIYDLRWELLCPPPGPAWRCSRPKSRRRTSCPKYPTGSSSHQTQILFSPASTYHSQMKLKITISGPKVHDVGYRPYLTELALSLALRGFEVFNDELNGKQSVVALIEGDETRVARFSKIATSTQPPLAKVESVSSEDYQGEIMPAWQFASMGTASQMNKAIPLLLEMKDDLKEMKGDIKEMKGDIKEMKGDIKAVRKNTDTIPQVLDEVRGIREDIQPGYATNFRQMQTDIRTIKERLGMI